MASNARHTVIASAVAALFAAGALAQDQPAETLDGITEDIDLLEQLDNCGFTADQLKAMVPTLEGLAEKHRALEDFRSSEEALAPMRVLREALIAGEASAQQHAATEQVWDRLMQLEDGLEEAVPDAMKQIAALLTDEQLTALSEGQEWSYGEADRVFAGLETARDFEDDTYNKWRDQEARQIAARAAGEGEGKAEELRTRVVQFMDKVKKLSEDQFMDQYDVLFDELQQLIAGSRSAPVREVAEAQAAEELEYLMRSERALPLVQAMIEARGG